MSERSLAREVPGDGQGALDAAAAELERRVAAAALAGGEGIGERLRAGIAELVYVCASEPAAARAAIVETRAAGAAAARRREAALERAVAAVEGLARRLAPDAPALAASGVVGGVEAVLYARLHRAGPVDLGEVLPALTYMATLPYEGREAANAALAGGTG